MTPVVLRCTERLTKLLELRRSDLVEPAISTHPSEWYGNLIWLDRRKCLLFTEASTLFSFLVPDVRKAAISPIGELLAARAQFELALEELPKATFGELDAASVQLARTSNRSTLGSMNELVLQCEYAVEDSGGLARTDITELNRRLRRIPMGALGYRFPIELARDHAQLREV